MTKLIIPYAAAAIIAAGSFFTGAVTDVGQAFQIAINKESAKIHCAKLVDGETAPTETTE